ncbi:exopolysaccharide biosynthesis protein [Arenimonas composti]|uniref:Exopolysaccharide biosynthesis protein n=1 Tax=Arenimonas composti TR7-09 = DSM 18010 TaxID=1121013 RepID=A0A091BBU9_9GAMM|nr:exopolysaccharide biosynthesis protein [Arenimonas composti]KFN49236.1 hypothetical protein P873_11770 [Arenimonas composti TR7-09 = DSM 18010]
MELSTRALIEDVAGHEGDADFTIGDLLDRFSERAFGVFLLIVLLPAFVPLPIGAGAISGPLVSLIGVQLMLQMEHPWVAGFIARRPLSRRFMQSFQKRTARVLGWLEKLTHPRTRVLIDHPLARAFTGLLLVLLGVLLALPLPATNYPFGFVLLFYCIALIERDGRMMAIAWALGIAELIVVALMSGTIATLVADFF